MKRAKIILTASALLLAVGGAFAGSLMNAPSDLYVKVSGNCQLLCASIPPPISPTCPDGAVGYFDILDCENDETNFVTAYRPQ